jgi:hypothetical protein
VIEMGWDSTKLNYTCLPLRIRFSVEKENVITERTGTKGPSFQPAVSVISNVAMARTDLDLVWVKAALSIAANFPKRTSEGLTDLV